MGIFHLRNRSRVLLVFGQGSMYYLLPRKLTRQVARPEDNPIMVNIHSGRLVFRTVYVRGGECIAADRKI